MMRAAGPAAEVRTAHAAHPGEKWGSPVNLASRSGVLDKLTVTAEMSTKEHSGAVLEVGSNSLEKGCRVKRRRELALCLCGHRAAIVYEWVSGERGL